MKLKGIRLLLVEIELDAPTKTLLGISAKSVFR